MTDPHRYDPEFWADVTDPLHTFLVFTTKDALSLTAHRVVGYISVVKRTRLASVEAGSIDEPEDVRAAVRELIAHGYLVPDGYADDGQPRYQLNPDPFTEETT